MPTAAKLVSSLSLALLALVVVFALAPALPAGRPSQVLLAIALVLALLTGWRLLGRDVGRGWLRAALAGVKSAVILTVVTLAVMSFGRMIERSMHQLYEGPVDALVATFALMEAFAPNLLRMPVPAMVICGGLLCGLLAESAGRRWR